MTTFDKRIMMGRSGQDGLWTQEGQHGDIAMTRQQSLITTDQLMAWALTGHMFHAQQGNATTKLDFAETSYDEDQPQFALRVPEGKTVIPVSLVNILEDMGGADNHIVWSRTTNDIGSGTSTAATIYNARTDSPFTSGCTARSLYTGNATAATGLVEIIRFFAAQADASTAPFTRFEWNVRLAAMIPVIVGPGTLQMHLVGATAPQGYGEYAWIEFDTPAIVKT